LAGFKAEDLEITLDDGLLKVSGSRSFDTPEGAKTYRSELARGTFSRTLRVTDAYDADKVNASYANGLLEILLEKRPEVLPRTIEIATS
jgi:HSP20 family protein